jgi:hypothetical protein
MREYAMIMFAANDGKMCGRSINPRANLRGTWLLAIGFGGGFETDVNKEGEMIFNR